MIIPSPRSKRKVRLEIIPLIDIIFFLLATFMMVSMSMVKHRGMDVRLATAATGTQQVKDSQYTAVSVTRSGELYLDKEKITADQLPERLNRLRSENKDPKIILTADRDAAYGTAVSALDQIRKNGIQKVILQTRQPEK